MAKQRRPCPCPVCRSLDRLPVGEAPEFLALLIVRLQPHPEQAANKRHIYHLIKSMNGAGLGAMQRVALRSGASILDVAEAGYGPQEWSDRT